MTEAKPVEDELSKHPAAASDKETLALKPNSYEDAVSGPDEQVSQTAYVTWTRPDGGGSFVAPIANSETYERKGFKRGAEVEMEDIVAWNAENAGKAPPKAEAHPRGEHAEAPKPKAS
jgi:hypothetical protein